MRILALLLPLLVLGACAENPRKAEERRQKMIASLLPTEVARQGVYLVSPVGSGSSIGALNFVWDPEILSDADAYARVSGICQRSGLSGVISLRQDNGQRTAQRGDRSEIVVRDMWFDCEP